MKTLSVAVDIYDEFYVAKRFFTKQNLRDQMAYIRSLGATDVEWIVDDMWSIYDEGGYPPGFDLLKEAVIAAHEAGLKFVAVYKPFEGGLSGIIIPTKMPRPEGVPVWEGLEGLVPVIRPFAVEHPEMCMQRRPSDADPGGSIREIRLVKKDDSPVDVHSRNISIYTGETPGQLTRHEGPCRVDISREWRPLFPLGATCTIINISELDIPASQKYIDVRFDDKAFREPFRNDYDMLVEAVNADGYVIPLSVAAADHPRSHYARQLSKLPWSEMVRYARHPDAQAVVNDDKKLDELCADFGAYGRDPGKREYALDERKQIAFARGKVEYMRGIMNPVYEEVRTEWLKMIQRCIDVGSDAVNVRVGSHLNVQDQWAYGFNPPVLKQLNGEENVPEACRIMGEAFTQFLRDTRDLLHAKNREMGVHVLTNFVKQRDEGMAKPSHEMMLWEWEKWIAEIADFAELRGAMGMRPETLRYTVDLFGSACRKAGIPLLYQSNRRAYTGLVDPVTLHPDRLRALEHEMAYAWSHPGVSGFQYYETANFTMLDDAGNFVGSEQMLELSRKFGLVR